MRFQNYRHGQVASCIEFLNQNIYMYLGKSHATISGQGFNILQSLSYGIEGQKTFHGIQWHLYHARGLIEKENDSLIFLDELISHPELQTDFQVEAARRDSFGNPLQTARFETFLANAILHNTPTAGLIAINDSILDYLLRHEETLKSTVEKAIRESLINYKLCEEKDFKACSALNIFRELLSRPLDNPVNISECITLHLIFFNYKNIFDPKLDNPDSDKQRAQRWKQPGEMFDAKTRGRKRKNFTKPSTEFGITDIEVLPEWAADWHRVNATPHKYRVNKNYNSPIVQAFQRHNIPFIAGPSGTAFDIASGLQLLAPEISEEQRTEYFNLLAAVEVAQGHHSLIEVLLPLIGMGYFPELLREENSTKPWQDLDYQFVYVKFLSNHFKFTSTFLELRLIYPQYLQDEAIPLALDKIASEARKMRRAALKVQRFLRANDAYGYMRNGSYWKQKPLSHRDFREQSSSNLQKMRSELGALTEAEQAFCQAFLRQSFDVTHYTRGATAVSNHGVLLSKVELEKQGIKHDSSSSADNAELKNGGFVFFRFEVVHDQTKTSRFGNQAFVLEGFETDLFTHGWVSMVEMFAPLSASVVRELRDNDKTIRKWTSGSTCKQLIFDYPDSGQIHNFEMMGALFYGRDIVPGIALTMVRELRRIGGDFQSRSLQGLDSMSLSKTLSQLFRVEAKIPSRVVLANAAWQLFESAAQGSGSAHELQTAAQGSGSAHEFITVSSYWNTLSLKIDDDLLLNNSYFIDTMNKPIIYDKCKINPYLDQIIYDQFKINPYLDQIIYDQCSIKQFANDSAGSFAIFPDSCKIIDYFTKYDSLKKQFSLPLDINHKFSKYSKISTDEMLLKLFLFLAEMPESQQQHLVGVISRILSQNFGVRGEKPENLTASLGLFTQPKTKSSHDDSCYFQIGGQPKH